MTYRRPGKSRIRGNTSDSRYCDAQRERARAAITAQQEKIRGADHCSHSRIMFGKHTGKLWQEVPGKYLMWLAKSGMPGSAADAGRELMRRRYKDRPKPEVRDPDIMDDEYIPKLSRAVVRANMRTSMSEIAGPNGR